MNQNENRPHVDFSTAVPLGVGVVAFSGICLLLIASRLASPRSAVQIPDTATPFHYLFIGTEPGISSAVPSPVDDGFSEETLEPGASDSTPDTSAVDTPRSGFSITAQSGVSSSGSSSSTQASGDDLTDSPVIIIPGTQKSTLTVGAPLPTRTSTPTFVPTATSTPLGFTKTPISFGTLFATTSTPASNPLPTGTPTSASTAPLNAGTYDDTDSHIQYIGNWVSQNNVGDAYQNTLHVSTTIGNSISFRFIGQELRLFFIAGTSLGTIRITIDQQSFDLLQESDTTSPSEWVSTFYTNGGTHTVSITHQDGGSVNLDQIIIPEIIPTATP